MGRRGRLVRSVPRIPKSGPFHLILVGALTSRLRRLCKEAQKLSMRHVLELNITPTLMLPMERPQVPELVSDVVVLRVRSCPY